MNTIIPMRKFIRNYLEESGVKELDSSVISQVFSEVIKHYSTPQNYCRRVTREEWGKINK
jgi:hypothetical protein